MEAEDRSQRTRVGGQLATSVIAKARNHLATRYRMKRERIHEMVVADILAQRRIIGVEQMLRCAWAVFACAHVAAGVKQQRRVGRDADIADQQEQRACGLAMAVDAKALA